VLAGAPGCLEQGKADTAPESNASIGVQEGFLVAGEDGAPANASSWRIKIAKATWCRQRKERKTGSSRPTDRDTALR
jgi:hypothetical protein